MIDHVSIGVSELQRSKSFYEQVLATIGLSKLVEREGTVGFGKRYPEFWINLRDGVAPVGNGAHICLRAPDTVAVDAFHDTALELGATSKGAPGARPEYNDRYYAAFIRDLDGNRIEAVTFVNS